LWLPPCKGGAL